MAITIPDSWSFETVLIHELREPAIMEVEMSQIDLILFDRENRGHFQKTIYHMRQILILVQRPRRLMEALAKTT